MQSPLDSYDYLIVGAGPAGCLLANRLSADPSIKVLLIEAGGRDNYPWIHIPVGYLYCIGNPRTDWCYETTSEPGLNGRSLKYPRGRVLGGSSSINGMIYMRGQSADYDSWAAQGNAGWAWDEVLPLFKRCENHFAGDSPMHGGKGEWKVSEQRLSWQILEAFRQGAAQVGIPSIEDFNTGDNLGCSYFQVNQSGGVRWNAAKAFLRDIQQRPNLLVITDTLVDRIELSEGRADSLRLIHQGQPKTIRAKREIILCAGAIGTPALLQRSGIGPRAVLDKRGIGVRHELSGVGANLQDHLQLRLIYKVSGVKTLNQMASNLWGKMGMGLEYLLKRSGPLSMAPSQLGAFARSSPEQASANLQYHVQPLSLERFGDPLHSFPAFTASVCNVRPHSRGHVQISSVDPAAAPIIQPNYLSDERDLQVAADAIRLTRKIVASPALAPFKPEEYKPGPAYQTQADLERAAGDIGTTIFHPVGTCKMGSDSGAVVDAQLRVHGIGGLRIADASIMPTIISGNTCSPVVMIAEKASDLILKEQASLAAITVHDAALLAV